MNPEIKERWLKALRSGEYKQGTGWLQMDGKYCCLGVLCAIVADEIDLPVEERTDVTNATIVTYGRPNDKTDTDLPNKVVEYVGLGSSDPVVEVATDYKRTLSNLNDNGMTFLEIADIIEREL